MVVGSILLPLANFDPKKSKVSFITGMKKTPSFFTTYLYVKQIIKIK